MLCTSMFPDIGELKCASKHTQEYTDQIGFESTTDLTLCNFTLFLLSLKKNDLGNSLVVQWVRLHTPKAGDPGLIPGQGIISHMHAATKSPHVATKSPHAATKKSACCN